MIIDNSNIKVIKSNLADHFGILLSLSLTQAESCDSIAEEERRSYTTKNIKRFCEVLDATDWSEVLATVDCGVSFTLFINILTTNLNLCFPLCKTSFNIRTCTKVHPDVMAAKSELLYMRILVEAKIIHIWSLVEGIQ